MEKKKTPRAVMIETAPATKYGGAIEWAAICAQTAGLTESQFLTLVMPNSQLARAYQYGAVALARWGGTPEPPVPDVAEDPQLTPESELKWLELARDTWRRVTVL